MYNHQYIITILYHHYIITIYSFFSPDLLFGPWVSRPNWWQPCESKSRTWAHGQKVMTAPHVWMQRGKIPNLDVHCKG